MCDEPDYHLELSGGLVDDQPADTPAGGTQAARPWIGIQFECCGVYTRIYRNREATAYEGRCPRCSRVVKVRVGAGGTSQRMFRAH